MPLPLAVPAAAAAAPAVTSGASALASALAMKAAEGAALAVGSFLVAKGVPAASRQAKELKKDIGEEKSKFDARHPESVREKAKAAKEAAKRLAVRTGKRLAGEHEKLSVGAVDAALQGAVEGAVTPSKSNPKSSARAEIEEMLRTAPSAWHAQFGAARGAFQALGMGDPGDKLTINNVLSTLRLTAGGKYSNEEPGDPGPKPPPDVQDAALHGLRLSHRNNYGGDKMIGLARAILLALGMPLSREGQKRMRNYLSRHRGDKRGRNFGNDFSPSNGYMAWLNWGGDAGKEWLEDLPRTNPMSIPSVIVSHTPRSAKLGGRNVVLDTEMYVRALNAELDDLRAGRDYTLQAHEDVGGTGVILNIRLLRPRFKEKRPFFSLHVPAKTNETIHPIALFLQAVQDENTTDKAQSLLPPGTELRAFFKPPQENPMSFFARNNPWVGSDKDFRQHSIDTAKHLTYEGEVKSYDIKYDGATGRYDIVANLKSGQSLPTQKYAFSQEKAVELVDTLRRRAHAGGYISEDVDPVASGAYVRSGAGAAASAPRGFEGRPNAFMQGAGRGIYEITFIDPEVFEAVKNNPKSFEKIIANNMQSTNDDRVLMAEAQRLQSRGLMVYVRGPGLAHQGWLD